MKTNKQQLVILMLLVIPATITIVTTTTTQQASAKSGSSRGQSDASRDTQGLNDNGVPTYDSSCPKHSDCTQYQSDYNTEWNRVHSGSSSNIQQQAEAQSQKSNQICLALCNQQSGQAQASGQYTYP